MAPSRRHCGLREPITCWLSRATSPICAPEVGAAFADAKRGHRCSRAGGPVRDARSANGTAAVRAESPARCRRGDGSCEWGRTSDVGPVCTTRSRYRRNARTATWRFSGNLGAKAQNRTQPGYAGSALGLMATFQLPWGEHRVREATDSLARQPHSPGVVAMERNRPVSGTGRHGIGGSRYHADASAGG